MPTTVCSWLVFLSPGDYVVGPPLHTRWNSPWKLLLCSSVLILLVCPVVSASAYPGVSLVRITVKLRLWLMRKSGCCCSYFSRLVWLLVKSMCRRLGPMWCRLVLLCLLTVSRDRLRPLSMMAEIVLSEWTSCSALSDRLLWPMRLL